MPEAITCLRHFFYLYNQYLLYILPAATVAAIVTHPAAMSVTAHVTTIRHALLRHCLLHLYLGFVQFGAQAVYFLGNRADLRISRA